MNNDIVGIRYTGKKPQQEDTVCKTGAVWQSGQVHNFSGALAKMLLVHTDSFERAEVSMDGGTYLAGSKKAAAREVAPFVNLTAMNAAQMALMARTQLNRVVSIDGKDEAKVRREVHALMATVNLDEEADRQMLTQADGRVAVPYLANPEEYAALMSGAVVLAIVPAEVAQAAPPPGADEVPTGELDTEPANDKPAEDQGAIPLPDLLASLDKPGLMAFAKQEAIVFSNNLPADKLRKNILAELTARG